MVYYTTTSIPCGDTADEVGLSFYSTCFLEVHGSLSIPHTLTALVLGGSSLDLLTKC